MRKDRNGLRITGVLIIVCLACLCGAAQGEDANDDGSETDLDVALKFGAFFSYGPDDEVLFPERDSALGLGRVRLTINHRFNRTANAQIAYEHQVKAVSHGATLGLGGGGLPSFSDPAYRITPLADEIVDETRTFTWRHELDRALVALHPDWGEVTLGRQAIGLGRGVIFGSVDIFAPFSPLEVDREWRQGVDAARFEYRLSPTSSVELLGAFGESWDDSALLARCRGYVGRFDGEIIAGKRGQDAMCAGVLSAFVGGAEMHGEIAVLNTPEEQADGGLFGNERLVSRATLGASYTLNIGNGLNVLGEYQHNGLGVRDPEDLLPRLTDPDFQKRLLRGDMRITGRHGLALQASYPINNAWSGALLLVGSPKDGSGVGSPSLSWDVSDHVTLDAVGFVPWGSEPDRGILQSEYGGRPLALFLQVSMYY